MTAKISFPQAADPCTTQALAIDGSSWPLSLCEMKDSKIEAKNEEYLNYLNLSTDNQDKDDDIKVGEKDANA